MIDRKRTLTGLLFTVICLTLGVGAWWLVWRSSPPSGKATTSSPPPPAAIPKIVKEDQLNVITLTSEAVKRLALKTAAVEFKPMPRTRVYGGEIMIPVGQSILVSAPVSGTLKAAGGAPAVGREVKKGEPLFELQPLLTPEGRANLASAKAEADGQVKTAQAQVDAARIALDRARRVFESDAGSRRAVDEAQAQFDLAQRTWQAAAARRDLLEKVVGEVEKGTAAPLPIDTPQDGMLRNLTARAGQTVPAGAPLFEVVNAKRVWVRVPVHSGDLSEVDPSAEAEIGDLAMQPDHQRRLARRTAAPPTAQAAAGTVDWYYDLDNSDARYSPGQRVGVSLTLKSQAKSLTVPWSAVVHDVNGGTWVYVQTDEQRYARQRVAVRYVVGKTAVLASGPEAGTPVVVAGAAELFGAETGFTK